MATFLWAWAAGKEEPSAREEGRRGGVSIQKGSLLFGKSPSGVPKPRLSENVEEIAIPSVPAQMSVEEGEENDPISVKKHFLQAGRRMKKASPGKGGSRQQRQYDIQA